MKIFLLLFALIIFFVNSNSCFAEEIDCNSNGLFDEVWIPEKDLVCRIKNLLNVDDELASLYRQDIGDETDSKIAQEKQEFLSQLEEEIRNFKKEKDVLEGIEISEEVVNKEVTNKNDSKEEKQNLTIFISIIVLIIGSLAWNKFIRRRCPECKSTKYILEKKTELDRFRQAKEVSELTASGKNKTTHVQVTYAINKYDYKCNVCGNFWSEEIREEK